MSARVISLDPAGEIGYVERALVGVPGLRVELADRLPSGPGIVALLVPPEVAVRAGDVAALPDLRIVAATSTGYDHLELAWRRPAYGRRTLPVTATMRWPNTRSRSH